MKVKILFPVSLFCLLIVSASPALAEVTVHGHVYYWNLEQGINATVDTDPEEIDGGRYLPYPPIIAGGRI